MRKIRVLQIIDKLEIGGVQTSIRDLVKYKNFFGNIEFAICVLRSSESEVKINTKNIYRLRWIFGPFLIFKIFKIARKNKTDIIHLHLHISVIFGVIVSFFGNWKIIVHQHSMLNNPYYRIFLRISKDRIDSFIAVSETIRRELINRANIHPDKIRVINNYIDMDLFKPAKDKDLIRANLGIKSNDIVLGFVGRLIKQKGCGNLIKAIKKLTVANFNPIVLIVIGDGKLRKTLMEQSHNLGDKKRIIFLGYQEDLPKLITAFDISIIPSIYEPFGKIALESMAIKKPIISTNVDGLSELIRHRKNGLLIKKGSINQMTNAIKMLIVNKKLRKILAINGYKTAKKYDIVKILPYYEMLYKELLSK